MENRDSDNPILLVTIGFFIIFFIFLPSLYNANKEFCNKIILEISLFNLGFFTHFSEKALENYQTILAMKSNTMTWREISLVLKYTGEWVKYPFAILVLFMGIISLCLNKKSLLYRKFSMKSLSEHNKEHFASIFPVTGKGEYLQSLDSFDNGNWKIARTPAQFCVENKILTYQDHKEILWNDAFKNGIADMDSFTYGTMVLDKEKCEQVFIKQLGNKTRDFSKIPRLRQALISAFLAYGNDDKQSAISILDTCSISFVEKEDKVHCKCLSDPEFMKFVLKIYEKYGNTNSKLIAKHTNYELPWIMSLLYFARKKGILAPSQFLFVRPMDRTLWYVLHQCGGQVAWTEGLSAWLHYHAEEKEEKNLDIFDAESAYNYMNITLDSQGWLLEGNNVKKT